MKTILVTGANGQLGNEMRIIAKNSADNYIFTDVNQLEGLVTEYLDITDLDAVCQCVVDNKVDVIITHCCPSSIQKLLDDDKYSTNTLTDYLEQIHQAVEYKKWYFGHYHRNRNMSDKDILLYRQFLRIS